MIEVVEVLTLIVGILDLILRVIEMSKSKK